MSQFAGMWNLATAYRTDLVGGDCDNSSGLAGQSHKLDFIRFVLRIDVNHGSDVAGFETVVCEGRGQNYSVVFVNHVGSILQGMGRDQSWCVCTCVDNPDRSNRRRTSVRALDLAFDSIFGAVLGFRR